MVATRGANRGLCAWIFLLLSVTYSPPTLATAPVDEGPQVEASARSDFYADQWVSVFSPAARISIDGGTRSRLALEAGAALDMLSGATPLLQSDVTTAATTFEDRRIGADLQIRFHATPRWDLSLQPSTSYEPDHFSQRLTLRSRHEAFHRRAQIAYAYALGHEAVSRVGEASSTQSGWNHAFDLAWNHLLRRRNTSQIATTIQYSHCESGRGCQANPYRRVAILSVIPDDSPNPVAVLMMPSERHPDRRLRVALGLSSRQYLGAGTSVALQLRGYRDNWSLQSLTARSELAREFFRQRLVLRLEARTHWQTAASFFHSAYRTDFHQPKLAEYRSADEELSRSRSLAAGLRLAYRWPLAGKGSFELSGRLMRLNYRYFDLGYRPDRGAWLAGVGVGRRI